MKKELLITVVFLTLFVSCGKKYTLDEMKAEIVEQEAANLPLLVQHWSEVEDVVIDSLVVTTKQELFAGYLVTRWTYVSLYLDDCVEKRDTIKDKKMLVEVTGINPTMDHLEWQTDWDGAHWDLNM